VQSRLTASLAIAAVLGVAGCGGDVDKDKAQDQIKSSIAAQTKGLVKYVKCPGGVKAEKGATFQCEALIPVNVTQVDDKGNVRWQITSFTGPPLTGAGATGATGAVGTTAPGGLAGGATGSTGAGGAAAGAGATAGGAVKDSPRFETFTNRALGYSIAHPILWKNVGSSNKDVNFSFNGRFIHLVDSGKGKQLPTLAQARSNAKLQPGLIKLLGVSKATVAGEPALRSEFKFQPQGQAVQVIKRYLLLHDGQLLTIDLGAMADFANKAPLKKKFDRALRSFRWRNSGT
jgi:hypothetical protein